MEIGIASFPANLRGPAMGALPTAADHIAAILGETKKSVRNR